MFFNIKPGCYRLVFLMVVFSCLSSSTAWSDTDGVEPKADTIFKQMSDYLATIEQFEISTQSSIETMLDSGQKIMLHHSNVIVVKRPDRMYSSRKGDFDAQSFYYDGTIFTDYDHIKNQYTVVDVPGTLPAALDFAIKTLELATPGVDLLYPNSYEKLSRGLLDGFYISKSVVNDIECHHLAFRNGDVDWQIWIQTGDKPLPIKYVITSRWITGAPQYSIIMTWNVKPDISDDIFKFVPSDTAKKITMAPKS